MRLSTLLLAAPLATLLVTACGVSSTTSVSVTSGSKTIASSPARTPAVAAGLTAEGALSAGAKLVLDKVEHQFGQVPDKAKLEYDFLFRNGGDQGLEIVNVKASCGCTTPTLEKNIYGPGEEGQLGIVWETKGHGGQSKSLDVTWRELAEDGTPATETQKTTLYIRATILPFLSCTPPRLDFGNLQRDSEGEVFVDITCKDPNFQILSFDSPQVGPMATDLKAELVEPPTNGRARVRFTYRETVPSFGPRQLFPKITIRTSGTAPGEDTPKERTHDMTGIVVLYSELVCEPAFFAVGKVAPQGNVKHEVILKRPSGLPFNVLSTEIETSTMPGLQVTAQKLPNTTSGESYKLVLSGNAGAHMGQVRGRVMVTTDVPGDERIPVDFMGIVRN